MNDQELRELVNPVFNTAISCVQLNAAAGDKDAQRLLETLGFPSFGAQTSNKPVPKEIHEQVRKLFPAYTILIETRFQAMNRLIERMKGRQIVDLPCGYTSRGIRLSREGRTYFGFDLPAVIDAMIPAVDSIIGKRASIAYHAVDATNYESLENALPGDSRGLLVTTEGLLMYFAQSELEEVFSNIHRLLQRHGGSWVITDRAYFLHDKEVVAATLNNDPALTAMYAAVTNRAAATTADVRFNDSVFFDPDDEKVRAFIKRMGFALHEICMADYLPDQIASLKGTPEAEPAVRDVFKKMMFWELTVAEDTAAKPVDFNLPFQVESEMKDGTFHVSIQGRMDTITAPELLRQFQNAGGGIQAIHVDVSRMAYVSSAGLRVLLMMYKSLDSQDRFEMTGVSNEIREILETTGFDQFLLKN
ncbi:MAG: STAS domain-containing protein [Clostridia bacterium]|nr:STAS domain-containing protein [Clostridia bacterium]